MIARYEQYSNYLPIILNDPRSYYYVEKGNNNMMSRLLTELKRIWNYKRKVGKLSHRPRQKLHYEKFVNLLFLIYFLDAKVRRENFLRLKQLILVGGPGDEIITPWQSAYV